MKMKTLTVGQKEELESLNYRLKDVIKETCNKIRCKNCPSKEYDEKDKADCEALQLQREIYNLKYK